MFQHLIRTCRQVLLTNAQILTLTFVVFTLTFGLVLPLICNNWIYSNYYLSTLSKTEFEKEALKLNSYYASKAKKYLSSIKYNRNTNIYSNEYPDLAIGIITVPRGNMALELGYLSQTVAKFLQILQHNETKFHSKKLFICNVFAGPGNHTEAQNLQPFTDIIDRFPRNNPAAVIMDRFEKEKSDYAYCLDAALRLEPKYVLLVEDDTLPYANFLEVLSVILDTMLERKWHSDFSPPKFEHWSYLKLYYPERWKGYAFEAIPLIELTGIGVLGGSIFTFLKFLYSKKLEESPISVCFVVGFLYTVLIALMIGRQYLIGWRQISKFTYTIVPAPDCCSPAILYRSSKAQQLSVFLKTQKCSASFPLDYAIDKFSKTYKYEKYLIEPNVMQHIGMVSSIKTLSDRPQEFVYRRDHEPTG